MAVPFGLQVERFRNPGPNVTIALDGEDTTQVAPHSGDTHWYAGYESQSDNILDVDVAGSGDLTRLLDLALHRGGLGLRIRRGPRDGEWVTVPLVDDSGAAVTTERRPARQQHRGQRHHRAPRAASTSSTSPQYVHYTAQLPAGATDVRFRYSTDAAYLDTGWFVDDVMVNGAAATLSSAEGEWFETNGLQDNNWTLQVVASCDLTPGVDSPFEIADGAGNFVYRLEGDAITQGGFNTKCANGQNRDFATLVSNLPTGDLTYLDAGYVLSVTNTGTGRKG